MSPVDQQTHQKIRQKIYAFLAEVLFYEQDDIHENAGFDDLGLDSVLGVEFLAMVNAEYGLDEQVDNLFEHPSPSAFAAYVAARISEKETTEGTGEGRDAARRKNDDADTPNRN